MAQVKEKLRNRFLYRTKAASNSSVIWNHPYGGSETSSADTVQNEYHLADNVQFTFACSNTLSSVENSQRAAKFVALHAALKNMSSLPTGHVMFIDAVAAKRAADRLAVIAHNYKIDPPKVLAEDDGAVVLTWDYGTVKRYLTIDQDSEDIMDLHKKSAAKCVHEVDESHDNFIELLGFSPFVSSATGKNV